MLRAFAHFYECVDILDTPDRSSRNSFTGSVSSSPNNTASTDSRVRLHESWTGLHSAGLHLRSYVEQIHKSIKSSIIEAHELSTSNITSFSASQLGEEELISIESRSREWMILTRIARMDNLMDKIEDSVNKEDNLEAVKMINSIMTIATTQSSHLRDYQSRCKDLLSHLITTEAVGEDFDRILNNQVLKIIGGSNDQLRGKLLHSRIVETKRRALRLLNDSETVESVTEWIEASDEQLVLHFGLQSHQNEVLVNKIIPSEIWRECGDSIGALFDDPQSPAWISYFHDHSEPTYDHVVDETVKTEFFRIFDLQLLPNEPLEQFATRLGGLCADLILKVSRSRVPVQSERIKLHLLALRDRLLANYHECIDMHAILVNRIFPGLLRLISPDIIGEMQ